MPQERFHRTVSARCQRIQGRARPPGVPPSPKCSARPVRGSHPKSGPHGPCGIPPRHCLILALRAARGWLPRSARFVIRNSSFRHSSTSRPNSPRFLPPCAQSGRSIPTFLDILAPRSESGILQSLGFCSPGMNKKALTEADFRSNHTTPAFLNPNQDKWDAMKNHLDRRSGFHPIAQTVSRQWVAGTISQHSVGQWAIDQSPTDQSGLIPTHCTTRPFTSPSNGPSTKRL